MVFNKIKILFALSGLICAVQVNAQSRHDVAERNIKSCIERREIVKKKSVRERTTFTRYDKDGNTIELIEFDRDSVAVKWEKRAFNKNGDETLVEQLDSAGQVQRRIITEYERHGKPILRTRYNAAGEVSSRTETDYNTFGDKILETDFGRDGKMKEKTVYEYDAKGMLTSRKNYNSEGKLTETVRYEYEY